MSVVSEFASSPMWDVRLALQGAVSGVVSTSHGVQDLGLDGREDYLIVDADHDAPAPLAASGNNATTEHAIAGGGALLTRTEFQGFGVSLTSGGYSIAATDYRIYTVKRRPYT